MCYLLTEWANKTCYMTFATPNIQAEPTDYISDCYFCLTAFKENSGKNKHTIKHLQLFSAKRRIPHNEEKLVFTPPESIQSNEFSVWPSSPPAQEDIIITLTNLAPQLHHF